MPCSKKVDTIQTRFKSKLLCGLQEFKYQMISEIREHQISKMDIHYLSRFNCFGAHSNTLPENRGGSLG